LWLDCPACGTEQPADAAFCSSCGTALKAGAQRARVADPGEERKLVSVLFADLSGSTALGEKIDPEDVRDVQRELYGLVSGHVERHGGVTEKFAGDAVMAVFGIPQAHEDDAERAVLAAIAVRDDFSRFATNVHDRFGADVGIRVGVNTGEVVTGREAAARGDLMVSGDAVNVAARLQQAAEPGEVVVGERTRSATQRAIAYGEAVAHEAKGKSEPVRVSVAVAAIAEPARRGLPGLHAPMIGRDNELELLGTLARRVADERAPQLVTLFGAAGVGKSRLLSEFAAATPWLRRFEGRCLSYGENVTWWPLAEIVKAQAGIRESDPAAVVRDRLADTLGGMGDARMAEAIAHTIGLESASADSLEPVDVRRMLVSGWSRYFAALGREAPTAIVIEDVHWAPSPLLDLIDAVAASLEDTPVMIVCTARPELIDSRPSWGAGLRSATSISLRPLAADENGRLVSSLLDVDRLDGDVRDRICARAEGNPFYTEEILRMLIDEGAITRSGSGWIATERVNGIPIPDGVRGVIAARIDLLGSAERRALRECAVVGRTFWADAVGVDESALAALVQRELVSERLESSMEGRREFIFKHALTCDVAYSILPRAERRELHLRVARWIEELGDEREGEISEVLAHHYLQAIASGETDSGVRRRAMEVFVRAGRAALRRAAAEPAVRLLRAAMGLADNERDLALVELELASAEISMLETDAAIERLQNAAARFQSVGDREGQAQALGELTRALWYHARPEEALVAGEQAVAILEGLPESVALARALARRSQLEMLGGVRAAIPHAEEAVSVARRVGDRFAEANALINLATARSFRSGVPDAGMFAEATRIAIDAGAYDEAYRAAVNQVWGSALSAPLSRIEEVAAEAGGLPKIVESAFSDYLELSVHRFVHLPAGRWEEMVPHLTPEWEQRARSGGAGSGMIWLELSARVALARGDGAAARPMIAELVEWADQAAEPQRVVPARVLAAVEAAGTGDAHAVLGHVSAGLAILEGRFDAFIAELAVGAGRALHRLGAAAEARRFADELSPALRREAQTGSTIGLDVVEGLALLGEGRPREAAEHLQRARDLEAERGAMYFAACCDADLAEALKAAGDEAAAQATRERADAVLGPLGVVRAI
jgi:class 3 adenylate cyclase/tetratricopeptide (TPR) repeat protein